MLVIYKRFCHIFTVLTIFYILIEAQIIEYAEIKLERGRFACIKLNTSTLFEAQKKKVDNSASSIIGPRNHNLTASTIFMLMPADEADLPSNWNYLAIEDIGIIILYGYPSEEDNLLEIDILRYNLLDPDSSKVGIRLMLEDGNDLNMSDSNANQSSHEIELAFHQISLEKFLALDYPKIVDDIFSKLIWPQSRLTGVSSSKRGGVLIRIRSPSRHLKTIERLMAEIDRATGVRYQGKLCEFKKSKTISIEHLFRSVSLYPNWCTFRLISSAQVIH